MTFALILTLTMCSYPITFDALWQSAACCGFVLIIVTGLSFWLRRSLKQLGNALLMRATFVLMTVTLVGGIWSFALAIVTSRNYLICAGSPIASADLIRSANENYRALLTFQSIVGVTSSITFILALVSIFSIYFISRKIPR